MTLYMNLAIGCADPDDRQPDLKDPGDCEPTEWRGLERGIPQMTIYMKGKGRVGSQWIPGGAIQVPAYMYAYTCIGMP